MTKTKNNLAIIIFAYNRFNHFKKTFLALMNNEKINEFKIFVFIDGPKNDYDKSQSQEIENFLRKKKLGNKLEIRKNLVNKGLKNSIIDGVTEVFNEYFKVIVLEDDIVTNKNFIKFMSRSLNYYEKHDHIGTITGYSFIDLDKNYPHLIYLSQRHASWGWATWKNRWDKINWSKEWIQKHINKKNFKKKFNSGGNDLFHMLNLQLQNKIDSWAIIYNMNQYINESYCLCPKMSLVNNIGLDGTGVHCKKNDEVFSNFNPDFDINYYEDIKVDEKIKKKIYKSFQTPLYVRIINKFKSIF